VPICRAKCRFVYIIECRLVYVPICPGADLSFKPSADLSQCRFVLHPRYPPSPIFFLRKMHTSSFLYNSSTIQNPLLIYDFINDKYATTMCTITLTCITHVHFSVNSIVIIIVHVLHTKQFNLIATMLVFRSVSDKNNTCCHAWVS